MAKDERSKRQDPDTTQADSLLSAEQRGVCWQLAGGDTVDSRRAKALLAIDEGATQAEAGRRAGLTRNQVNYSLRKFRQMGLDMFSGATLDGLQPEPAAGAGGAETRVEQPGNKAGSKTAKGKKAKKKNKKSKKKDGGRKKRRKSRSGKSSRKKRKKQRRKKGEKKSKR